MIYKVEDLINPEDIFRHKAYREQMNFYTAREESFANVITYRIISNKGNRGIRKGLLTYVADFINHQPVQYAFAMRVYSFSSGIKEWIEAKTTTLISKQDAEIWMDAASAYWKSGKADLNFYESKLEEIFNQKQIQFSFTKYPWVK
jgi:hypothetical protein